MVWTAYEAVYDTDQDKKKWLSSHFIAIVSEYESVTIYGIRDVYITLFAEARDENEQYSLYSLLFFLRTSNKIMRISFFAGLERRQNDILDKRQYLLILLASSSI